MKRQQHFLLFVLLISLVVIPGGNIHAQDDQPVVRAVLFYSPTCGHCELVIQQTLLPMIADYGEHRLQIIGVDVTQPQGQELFLAALETFSVERGGVPFLVIDKTYLIGSADIPERFPILVESYMGNGGVDWPNLPGLQAILPEEATAAPQTDPSTATDPQASTSPTQAPALDLSHENNLTWQERFALDPAGNTLAVIVLVGMLAVVGWAVVGFGKKPILSKNKKWNWVIPVLCLVGIGVAGYLAYVEVFHATAVCGPVGDCNTVQQSEYARLFGILPIGVLGLVGYILMIAAWLVAGYTKPPIADFAMLALGVMASLGTLFSIYLTFLEPFVIGATCAWCLTSAIIVTALLVLSVEPAKLAWQRIRKR